MKDRERRLLAYLRRFIRDHGYPPTYREMAEAVGTSSTSAVRTSLMRMRSAGIVTWDPGKARTLRIAELGDGNRDKGRRQ